MVYFVYILVSQKDQSFYIGQTQNLKARIDRHNKGRNPATKSKIPWKLIFAEQTNSRKEAMKLEKKLKSLKKREAILRFILKNQNN